MKIKIDQLRKLSNALCDHLEANGYDEIEVSEDFYWDVGAAERYDRYDIPKKMTVGQLSDDWARLEGIADGSVRPVGYGLVWLSAVIRRIGEVVIG